MKTGINLVTIKECLLIPSDNPRRFISIPTDLDIGPSLFDPDVLYELASQFGEDEDQTNDLETDVKYMRHRLFRRDYEPFDRQWQRLIRASEAVRELTVH